MEPSIKKIDGTNRLSAAILTQVCYEAKDK
jgi:hypothetical protein